MYGSRTDKARLTGPERRERAEQRSWDKPERDLFRTAQDDINEQIAMLDDDEPAKIAFDMDRLHAEALKMHERWYDLLLDNWVEEPLADWEAELVIGGVPDTSAVAWSSVINDEVEQARMALEREEQRAREAQYDGAYGGYSDDPDDGDHSGSWIPFMRIEELRETFGQNWLGNGFHIVQGNGIRRTK